MRRPTKRQVALDIAAERVLAPTDWTMDPDDMVKIVRKQTGARTRDIQAAMTAVMEWDFATHDVDGLRKSYNLSL